jgi:hypothetical protein
MRVHAQLARDHAQHGAISVDHEGGTLCWQRAGTLHTELFGDGLVRVAQERKPEFVLVIKLLLPIRPIGTDSHDRGSEFCELGFQITKMLRLDRSTRRHRFDVEVQNQRPAFEQLAKSDRASELVDDLKVADGVSNQHAGNLALLPTSRRRSATLGPFGVPQTGLGGSPSRPSGEELAQSDV